MVKAHKEKELKMMINEEIYSSFLKRLELNTRVQTNFYYNTFKDNMAMRIREIDNKYYFTLKVKQDGYKDEYEFEIKDNSLNDSKVIEVLNAFNIDKYEYLGCMKTTRSIKEMKNGELCVDKSEYNNTVDYEIEYELYDATNDDTQEFFELLKEFNLIFIPSNKTKLGRFKATL